MASPYNSSRQGNYFQSHAQTLSRESHPIAGAFRFLADSLPEDSRETQDLWKGQEYIFPFSNAQTSVVLTDYEGDFHYTLRNKINKNVVYTRCDPGEDDFETRIRAKLTAMCEGGSENCENRIEVDFPKITLSNKKPSNVDCSDISTIDDLQSKLKSESSGFFMSSINSCLPAGPNALLGIMESLGGVLAKVEENKDGTIRCISWYRGFEHRGRKFNGSLVLNSSDLVFCEWGCDSSYSEAVCLTTPVSCAGSSEEDEVICDLRIKTKSITNICSFQDLWSNLENEPPLELTTPGLNGTIRRNDNGEGFIVSPDAPIIEVVEKMNTKYYHFDLDGVNVQLATSDGRNYKVLKDGKCCLSYEYKCCPKLIFWIDNQEQIPRVVDVVTNCVITLINAFSERRLEAVPWQIFLIFPWMDSASVRSSTVKRMKRISDNEKLDDMLGVHGETNTRVLSLRLQKVLKDLEDVKVTPDRNLNPNKLKQKLVEAAREIGVRK